MTDFVAEVESGDRRRGLEVLRKRLADEIAAGEYLPRDLPSLVRQLQSVMTELDGLPTARKGTPSDELEKRRQKRASPRRAGADVPPGVAAGGESRRRR